MFAVGSRSLVDVFKIALYGSFKGTYVQQITCIFTSSHLNLFKYYMEKDSFRVLK
jgi:hypothetical protein